MGFVPSPLPTRRGCHASLSLSLSLLHTWSWRGGQERGDLTLSPGKSASGARREKSLGRKRNQRRRRPNYQSTTLLAPSAAYHGTHHVLPLFFPESNRHHSILATEHPAARSIDRTNMYMYVHGFHLYTCSIVCRTVRYMARGSLVARSTATRTRALTVRPT